MLQIYMYNVNASVLECLQCAIHSCVANTESETDLQWQAVTEPPAPLRYTDSLMCELLHVPKYTTECAS